MFANPMMINGKNPGQQASSHLGVAIAHIIAINGAKLVTTINVILFPILSIIAPKNGDMNETIKKGIGVHMAALSGL